MFPKLATNKQIRGSYPFIRNKNSTPSEVSGIIVAAKKAIANKPKYPSSK